MRGTRSLNQPQSRESSSRDSLTAPSHQGLQSLPPPNPVLSPATQVEPHDEPHRTLAGVLPQHHKIRRNKPPRYKLLLKLFVKRLKFSVTCFKYAPSPPPSTGDLSSCRARARRELGAGGGRSGDWRKGFSLSQLRQLRALNTDNKSYNIIKQFPARQWRPNAAPSGWGSVVERGGGVGLFGQRGQRRGRF